MDEQLTQLLEGLADQVLASPQYASLPEDQKQAKKEEILEELNSVILDSMVDNLSDEQVLELQNLDPNSPDMEAKLTEYSATIPDFLNILQTALNTKVEELKNPVPPTN
jgi:hypothetical protein